MIEDISPVEFLHRRDAGELWQLLDVREQWEIDTAGVGGTINIPMGEISQRYAELDTATPIAVMCHSGGRSAKVAGYLASAGFAQVANIAGGIDAWSQTIDESIPRY